MPIICVDGVSIRTVHAAREVDKDFLARQAKEEAEFRAEQKQREKLQ